MEIIGKDYRNAQPVRIEISGDKITGIHPYQPGREERLSFVAPGLWDLQVNGYAGVDFNGPPVLPDEALRLTRSLWKQGVTSFFPTVITHTPDRITASLKAICRAMHRHGDVDRSVAGIHLEGPFISPEDGPRGAHDKQHVRPPDTELFFRWQEAAEGKIRIITLSPEWPGSPEFIARCVSTGVKVSIGHTAASPVQIRDAIAAGATMSTHLGNGCHLMLPRHSNYLWEQLASEELWCGIISDGFHLPDAVLKVFLKAKPDKSFLVSDTTSFAGLPPGVYTGHIGGEVELSPEGRLCVRDTPDILAGSAQSLLWCVTKLIRKGILPLEKAWDLASQKPKECLSGTVSPPFRPGESADLVLFDLTEEGPRVVRTIKSGRTGS